MEKKINYWCSCGCGGYGCYNRICDNLCFLIGQQKLRNEDEIGKAKRDIKEGEIITIMLGNGLPLSEAIEFTKNPYDPEPRITLKDILQNH